MAEENRAFEMVESGTLPIGIERAGKIHCDFEVKPGLVCHSVEVEDEHAPEQLKNPAFEDLCLTAKQIVRIGDISPVSAGDLMDMYDVDLDEIREAQGRLRERLRAFHSESGRGKSAADPSQGKIEESANQDADAPASQQGAS